jgi:hypothetical protein
MKALSSLFQVFRRWSAASLILASMTGMLQAQIYPRNDTLFIPHVSPTPVVDGNAADALWDQAPWKAINQIWMPYDNLTDNMISGLKVWSGENDFTGKFKVLWSSETNLLYFLVEVTDDFFVDGYKYNSSNYPDYDIVEVFIDEDRSGGLHVFDGTGNTADQWGDNAENAFAYHIAANALAEGEIQRTMHAMDIAGPTWGTLRNYAGHFPEFAMVKTGNKYVYEFSLTVYNDTYNHNNPATSVINLQAHKVMGLTMAYCDNDDISENPLRRDHFFGSVEVPFYAHNDHWINADWFGVAKLLPDQGTSSRGSASLHETNAGIFIKDKQLSTLISSPFTGEAQIRIINIMGVEQAKFTLLKDNHSIEKKFNISMLQSGIYVLEITMGNFRKAEKIFIR